MTACSALRRRWTGGGRENNSDGAGLLAAFLAFSLITGAFAVLNVFDDTSYVIASAVSEQYVLTMMSLAGYFTYYLAYRKAKADAAKRGRAE